MTHYSFEDARELLSQDGDDNQPRCENCDHPYETHHWGDRRFQGCTIFDCSCSGYTARPSLEELMETDTRFNALRANQARALGAE